MLEDRKSPYLCNGDPARIRTDYLWLDVQCGGELKPSPSGAAILGRFAAMRQLVAVSEYVDCGLELCGPSEIRLDYAKMEYNLAVYLICLKEVSC